MTKQLSKCCSAPIQVCGSEDFGGLGAIALLGGIEEFSTMYYSCEACKQTCDVRPQKPSERINELVRLREVSHKSVGLVVSEKLNNHNWIASILDYLDEQAELNN